MQLFLTPYKKKDHKIIIENIELLSQLRKVLRTKLGDVIWVQTPINEAEKIRYKIRIDDRNEKELYGTVCSQEIHFVEPKYTTMLVAMPNKRDKIELIVQKLSEIGINQIVFWPAERSIIKERNTNKKERLEKISKEAIEQSRGRILPSITFISTLNNYLGHTEIVIFDKTSNGHLFSSLQDITIQQGNHVTGIIGPEGGLTSKDYQHFALYNPKIIPLGTTVLRMETAAIIGGRLLKNYEQLIIK